VRIPGLPAPGRVALVFLALLLGSCHGRWWDDDNERELTGRRWVLQVLSRDDGGVSTVPRDDEFTVEFDRNSDEVSVKADCNRCSGSYEAGERRLRISSLACTRAFCNATAPFDTEYVEQLEASHSYFVEGRLLTIRTDDGVLIFDR
jgi:heat shock protein HslJ